MKTRYVRRQPKWPKARERVVSHPNKFMFIFALSWKQWTCSDDIKRVGLLSLTTVGARREANIGLGWSAAPHDNSAFPPARKMFCSVFFICDGNELQWIARSTFSLHSDRNRKQRFKGARSCFKDSCRTSAWQSMRFELWNDFILIPGMLIAGPWWKLWQQVNIIRIEDYRQSVASNPSPIWHHPQIPPQPCVCPHSRLEFVFDRSEMNKRKENWLGKHFHSKGRFWLSRITQKASSLHSDQICVYRSFSCLLFSLLVHGNVSAPIDAIVTLTRKRWECDAIKSRKCEKKIPMSRRGLSELVSSLALETHQSAHYFNHRAV